MTYDRYTCPRCYYEGSTPCPDHAEPPLSPVTCSAADYANILEALGSIVETRCYLQKMRRLSEEGPLPDWTAVTEHLQGALRESEVVLTRVQRLYNSQRESTNTKGQP